MDASEPRMPRTLDEEIIGAEKAAVVSTLTDLDRIDRVERELRMGFDALAHVGAAASFFGSARTARDDPEYSLARETARLVGAVFARQVILLLLGGSWGRLELACCHFGVRLFLSDRFGIAVPATLRRDGISARRLRT